MYIIHTYIYICIYIYIYIYIYIFVYLRARSLVVRDVRSETKGSRFESSCQLCAEVYIYR